MAVYFLNLKTFGRSEDSSAVSAAAYRSGERIRDERTGRTYDHSDRRDVLHKEIILPREFAADDLAWAKDRSSLWNGAEQAEVRKNARVAREYLVALPAELSAEERMRLVAGFSRELVERYRFALDVAIHAPRDFPGSDPRNFHAHLLATTREATLEGLGAKTTLEWNDAKRREAGLGPAIGELLHVRQRWAMAANAALEQAHVAARIDHRTLRAQGIDREPGRTFRASHTKWSGMGIAAWLRIAFEKSISRGSKRACSRSKRHNRRSPKITARSNPTPSRPGLNIERRSPKPTVPDAPSRKRENDHSL